MTESINFNPSLKLNLVNHGTHNKQKILDTIKCLECVFDFVDLFFQKYDNRINIMDKKIKSIQGRHVILRKKIEKISEIGTKGQSVMINCPFILPKLRDDIYFTKIRDNYSSRFNMTGFTYQYISNIDSKFISSDVNIFKTFQDFTNIPIKTNEESFYKVIKNTSTNKLKDFSEDTSNNLFEAPPSIYNRIYKPLNNNEDFNYCPQNSNIPEFDLPSHLTNLPGIANDISLKINPTTVENVSAFSFLSVFNQNTVDDISEEKLNKNIKNNNSTEKSLVRTNILQQANTFESSSKLTLVPNYTSFPSSSPVTHTISSPPPPTPIVPSHSIPSLPLSAEEKSFHSIPPPPPPPLLFSTENNSNQETNSDPHKNDLLASIREAAGGRGKLKLKSVAQREINKAKPIKKSEEVATDFMSDLFGKLALRRKGISGNKESNDESVFENDNDDKFDPISSLSKKIPSMSNFSIDQSNEEDWN